mgnify:CR=1 FL=1
MIRRSPSLQGKRFNKLDEELRQVVLKDGTTISIYPLIVTTSDFGTRAFDYRGNKLGITLIIAKSLDHERDAL